MTTTCIYMFMQDERLEIGHAPAMNGHHMLRLISKEEKASMID